MPLINPRSVIVGSLGVILCSFCIGCGGTRQATASDDTFFKPLKSVNRPPASTSSGSGAAAVAPSWSARADSLLQTMCSQQQRLDAIAAHLQLLEASRRGAPGDSSRGVKKAPVQPLKPSPQREQPSDVTYGDALRLYQTRRYQEAIDAFEELLRRGVQEELQDNCHFWIGASHFSLKQFELALESLKRVVEWKGSNKREDAYYMLGRTYEQLGKGPRARTMFETLLNEFPGSALAPSARQRLKALKPQH